MNMGCVYFLQHTSWNILYTPRLGIKFFLLVYEILLNDCKMQENIEYVFNINYMASFFLKIYSGNTCMKSIIQSS
jgi:hypothetical protein